MLNYEMHGVSPSLSTSLPTSCYCEDPPLSFLAAAVAPVDIPLPIPTNGGGDVDLVFSPSALFHCTRLDKV
jgi:hypothetical protein